MSLGSISLLKGLGGSSQTKIVPGEEEGQVLIQQSDKVIVLNTEDFSISHTWYSPDGGTVVAAVRNNTTYEKASVLVGLANQVVFAAETETKLSLSPNRQQLTRTLSDIRTHNKEHLLMFSDGSVENLSYIVKQEGEGGSCSLQKGILSAEEQLLESWVFEQSGLSLVFHLVERERKLWLVRGRITYNPETTGLLMEQISRVPVFPRDSVLAWDLHSTHQGVAIMVWNKQGELLLSPASGSLSWRVVARLEEAAVDAGLSILSSTVCAVIYSKPGSDGGVVELISIPYGIVTSSAKLKTTAHRGRCLWFVGSRLYVVGLARVASCSVSQLDTGLDSFIGRMADVNSLMGLGKGKSAAYLYSALPKLIKQGATQQIVELISGAIDLPEQLLLQTVIYLLKLDTEEEKRLELLEPLLTREFSEAIMSGELAKLEMREVLKLMEIVCSIIESSSDCDSKEKRLLDWSGLLLNSNFIRIMLSKDAESESVINKLKNTVENLEMGVEASLESRSIITNMHSLQLKEDPAANLTYCIELIRI